jgi:hypothetical protein
VLFQLHRLGFAQGGMNYNKPMKIPTQTLLSVPYLCLLGGQTKAKSLRAFKNHEENFPLSTLDKVKPQWVP